MPRWCRDEYILILELYFQFRETAPAKNDPILIEYSNYLRSMNTDFAVKEPKYRNANGVYLRLMNYRSCDPFWTTQGKVGMTAGSTGKCKEIWEEFSGDSETVKLLASEIKLELEQNQNSVSRQSQEVESTSSFEGRKRLRIHYSRERASQRKQKIALTIKLNGELRCEVCEITEEKYISIRTHSIFEVHHIIPLAKADGEIETKLEDLAVLCANCHKAIHSIEPIPSVNSFKSENISIN